MSMTYTLEMRRTLCRLLAERGRDNPVTQAMIRLHVLVARTGSPRFKIQNLKLCS